MNYIFGKKLANIRGAFVVLGVWLISVASVQISADESIPSGKTVDGPIGLFANNETGDALGTRADYLVARFADTDTCEASAEEWERWCASPDQWQITDDIIKLPENAVGPYLSIYVRVCEEVASGIRETTITYSCAATDSRPFMRMAN